MVNVNVTKQGRLVEATEESAILVAKKQQIVDLNEELYILQVKVLRNNYDGEHALTDEQRDEVVDQCDALEREILVLCKEVRVLSSEQREAEGFDTWKKKQSAAAKDIKLLLGSATQNQAKDLAAKASAIEQQAATVVRELHASIARKDTEQFQVWRQARLSELQMLEAELAHARQTGKDENDILAQLENCCEDLDRMVASMKDEDSSDEEDSDSESDSDSDDDHEAVVLRFGDKVKLRRSEDGLAVGELAVVAEVDSDPTSTYPYRVVACTRRNGKAANGFFKARDLQLVQRAPPKPQPTAQKGQKSPTSTKSMNIDKSPKSLSGLIGNVRSISVNVNPLIIC